MCSRRIAAADVCNSSRLAPALPVCFGSTGCLREFSSRIVLSNSAELEGTGKNMLPTLEAPPLDGRLAAPANAPEPPLVLVYLGDVARVAAPLLDPRVCACGDLQETASASRVWRDVTSCASTSESSDSLCAGRASTCRMCAEGFGSPGALQ